MNNFTLLFIFLFYRYILKIMLMIILRDEEKQVEGSYYVPANERTTTAVLGAYYFVLLYDPFVSAHCLTIKT